MTPPSSLPAALIADDDEISRLFLVESLEKAGFRTVAVTDGAAALDAALADDFSLALLDVEMPKLDGYAVCAALRATPRLRHLPVVMITGHDDAESIARAYDVGATDFISKPVNWTLLPHRLRYVMRNADADRTLRTLAYFDALTGLPNRQALVEAAGAALVKAGEAAVVEGVALLHVGVDACTRISAVFGPDAGDEALRAFAHKLSACVAAADASGDRLTVARVDGDEFVVCLRDRDAAERASTLAKNFKAALDEPIRCGGHRFLLPPSIGIAVWPEHGRAVDTLLMHAATAKHHARATEATSAVTYTDDIGGTARDRLALGTALREAVRNEQLDLYFQPKIRISDGALVGVEALLRWFDPEVGEIPPERFVRLAEESGLILEIGRWVVNAACRQLRHWLDAGLETTMAINFSGKQFIHDDPANLIRTATDACGLDVRSIIVEITESALIGDLASVQVGLLAVKALGCRVAVDDFGTGYSSLAYLKRLPVNELKVDRAFIQHVDSDAVDSAICIAVLSLARDLGLSVTAEGVETDAQLEWLRTHGCEEAQGFLIARPMRGHEILRRYGNGGGIGAQVA
jgi:diguanylate cyclase (GGDEF)-like protein